MTKGLLTPSFGSCVSGGSLGVVTWFLLANLASLSNSADWGTLAANDDDAIFRVVCLAAWGW
jgi:hypothetical protein